MTTATTYAHIPASKGGASRGWWGRLFDRMVEAQMLVARRRICDHLRYMDDRTLATIGFSERDVKALRAGGIVDMPR